MHDIEKVFGVVAQGVIQIVEYWKIVFVCKLLVDIPHLVRVALVAGDVGLERGVDKYDLNTFRGGLGKEFVECG